MTAPSPKGVFAYVRALERRLEELHGPPFVLSPRDWALAEDWYQSGIPLAAVLESLDSAASRRSRRGAARRPPQLSDVKLAVEESWSVIRAGRLPEIRDADAEERQVGPLDLWERAVQRAGGHTPLGNFVSSLLARLRAGEDVRAVDESLEREIGRLLPAAEVEAVERAVDAELAPFDGRWEPEVLAQARERAIRSRIRRRLGLPRLLPPSSTPGAAPPV